MKKVILEVSNLKKYYGKQIGIEDVSFKLSTEEILGFIGPNGSGKSTTIKTILDLLKSDHGIVKIFGKEIHSSFTDIMQFVGYLPSEISSYENLTVEKFLLYAASFYEIDYIDNIYLLAKRLELDLNRKIKDLSLGNKRKVGLINALFHDPKLIILDEPTNGLDPAIQKELLNIIKERKDKGCAILFSSHNLNDIQALCDRVMIIKEGKIVSILEKKELKQSHKRFSIESNKTIENKHLLLPGIKDLHIEDKQATFLFAGDISELVKRLTYLELTNLMVSEPTLNELLLHYYK